MAEPLRKRTLLPQMAATRMVRADREMPNTDSSGCGAVTLAPTLNVSRMMNVNEYSIKDQLW